MRSERACKRRRKDESEVLEKGKREHVCPEPGCTKVYTKECRLQEHLQAHRGERNFACALCDDRFLRKSHLDAHKLFRHDTGGTDGSGGLSEGLQCSQCGARFKTKQHMTRHEAGHSKKTIYTCQQCKEEFSGKLSLNQHLWQSHAARLYTCSGDDCARSFDRPSKLERHIRQVHKKIKTFQCCHGDCTKEYNTESQLHDHITQAHPTCCAICDQAFSNSSNLKVHLATHQAPIESRRRFLCTESGCEIRFTRPSALQNHIDSAHLGIRSFTCSYETCGQSFATHQALHRHEGAIHDGTDGRLRQTLKMAKKKNQEPRIADLLSGYNYARDRHIECPVDDCLHRFLREYDLKRHLLSAHSMSDQTDAVEN